MNITLRKANALQTVVQEYLRNIEIKATATLTEFEDAEIALFGFNNQLVAADECRDRITRALYRMRALIGKANATSGVSDKLAECAYIDKRIAHMTSLANSDAQEALNVINGKLKKIAEDKSERRMYGYNDTVTTGVLRKEQIDAYKGIVLHLKKQKQKLNDEILELNVRTEIELTDEIANPLREVGLL